MGWFDWWVGSWYGAVNWLSSSRLLVVSTWLLHVLLHLSCECQTPTGAGSQARSKRAKLAVGVGVGRAAVIVSAGRAKKISGRQSNSNSGPSGRRGPEIYIQSLRTTVVACLYVPVLVRT